jgi:hypothetical protein
VTAPVDRERVAADWAACGFGCDLWVDPPGRRWAERAVHSARNVGRTTSRWLYGYRES